jgi:hypothetical protein
MLITENLIVKNEEHNHLQFKNQLNQELFKHEMHT